MNARRYSTVAVIVALCLAAAGAAAAQTPAPAAGQGADAARRAGGPPGPRAGAAGPGTPASGMTVAQAEQQFDRVTMNQARRVLDLDPKQFQAFRPRLQQLQMLRRRTQRERAVLVRELAQLDPSAHPEDETTITAKLDALKAFDADTAKQLQAAYAAIDEVLTPVQQARFRVLEQRMARLEQDLIARARQQAGAKPAP